MFEIACVLTTGFKIFLYIHTYVHIKVIYTKLTLFNAQRLF